MMSGLLWCSLLAFLALSNAQGNNTTAVEGSCMAEEGPFSCLLEEWATVATWRRGRVMVLPPTDGFYISDRIDLRPPPSPNQMRIGHHYPHLYHMYGPRPPGDPYFDEWQGSPPPPPDVGKIVNRPVSPYKDRFKPSYPQPPPPPPPSPNQPIPLPSYPEADDRDDDDDDHPKPPPPPPPNRVTETDLYLLTAIEKLVYRVDLMEKRLRKMEESVHYLVSGNAVQPDPCPQNFTRIGSACYYFSAEALDWKSANLRCRKLHANLLEFESDSERRQVHSTLLANKRLKGDDWWTGGLNPGLLWIWSHTARPVVNETRLNATASQSTNGGIVGEGRCLALSYNPAVLTYVYRGQECTIKNRFVCEREDKQRLSNEIFAVAKELKSTAQEIKVTTEAVREATTVQ